MKRLFIILSLTATALVSIAPHARALGVYATWWRMNESDDSGTGIGIRQQVKIVPVVSIDTRVAWLVFTDTGFGGDINVVPVEVAGLVSIGLFYGGLGLGYYFFDTDGFDAENSVGWFILGGVNLGAGPVGVFGEVKYTQLEADIKDIDPDLSDIPNSLDAAGMGINIGVNFGF